MVTRPAAKMFYSVAGRTVLIEPYDDWSTQAVSRLFAGWFLTSIPDHLAREPDATIRIRCGVPPPPVPAGLTSFQITHGGICHTNSILHYLELEGSAVLFGGYSPAEVDLWVKEPYDLKSAQVGHLLSHALSPALRRCHVFEIHSAGVVPPNSDLAIMFVGPSGSGKSTLTSLLASCGWSYLSDDILLLRELGQNIEAQAFRRFFALTEETITAAKLQSTRYGQSSKERVIPQEHFSSSQIESAIPGTIVYPTVTREPTSRIVPLTSQESMIRILRFCPWASFDKPTSAEHLRVLGRLANTTCSFELFAGTDLFIEPKLAAELLLSCVVETAESYVS
jgi:hypothetical protein